MKVKHLQERGDDCENTGTVRKCESENFRFKDDIKHFHAPLIGHVTPNRYCYCGRLRSMYADNISKLNSNLNLEDGPRETKNNLTNDALELSNSAVCVTKRSLMLNQFLELSDRPTANTAMTSETDSRKRNRFRPTASIPANNCRYSEDSSLSVTVANKGRDHESGARSMFSDKRLVSLFRSVALYWFFCLNTLLAKSDLLKRKTFASDCGGDNNTLTSFFADSGELKFRISSVVSDCFEEGVDYELLCAAILDALREDERARRNRVPVSFTDPSRRKVDSRSTTDARFGRFVREFRRWLSNSINNSTATIDDITRMANVTNEIALRRSVFVSYPRENCRIHVGLSSASELESSNPAIDRIRYAVVPYKLNVIVCERGDGEVVGREEMKNVSVEAATIDFESWSVQARAVQDGPSKDVARVALTVEQTNSNSEFLRVRFFKFDWTNDDDDNDNNGNHDDDYDDDDANDDGEEEEEEVEEETDSTCSSYSSELNSSCSLVYDDANTMPPDEECLLGEYGESETEHFEEDERNNDEETERSALLQQEQQQAISYAQMCSVIPRGILEDDVMFVREYKMWKSPNILEDYLKRTRSMEPTPVPEKQIRVNSPLPYQLFGPSKVGCDMRFSVQMAGKLSKHCPSNTFCPLGESRRQADHNYVIHDARPAENCQQSQFRVVYENRAQIGRREGVSPAAAEYSGDGRQQVGVHSPRTTEGSEKGSENHQSEAAAEEIRQESENEPAKEYKMWESPVFVKCLPELARLLHVARNGDTWLSTTRSICDPQIASRLPEIRFSSTATIDNNPQRRDDGSNSTTTRGGDELSFTDGGAFKYYNRTSLEISMKKMISFFPAPERKYEEDSPERMRAYTKTADNEKDGKDNNGGDNADDNGDTGAIIRSVEKSEEDELERHELNKDHYFRPIDPMHNVSTDPVPVVARSVSGSMYLNDRKYMTYKHELDATFTTAFQPKFEVRSNDLASQTSGDNQRILLDLEFNFLREDEAALGARMCATNRAVKAVQPIVHNSNSQEDALANVLHYLERSVLAGRDADMALAAYGYMDMDMDMDTSTGTAEYVVDPTSMSGYSNTVVAADFQRC